MLKPLASLWSNYTVLNRMAAVCAISAIALVTATAVLWTQRLAAFSIKEVVVTGLRGQQDLAHQNTAFIQRAVLPQLRGNYLTVRLGDVQTAFAQAAWIRHVNVRRVWPNRLWVEIEEHQAVAMLNDDRLVNEQGESFMAEADETLAQLPVLQGAEKDAARMLVRLQELNRWLAPSKAKAVKLQMSERRAWTAELSNNVVLEIGRDDLLPSAQERVSRFAKTWNTSRNVTNGAKYVDLRYTNGYAVKRAGT